MRPMARENICTLVWFKATRLISEDTLPRQKNLLSGLIPLFFLRKRWPCPLLSDLPNFFKEKKSPTRNFSSQGGGIAGSKELIFRTRERSHRVAKESTRSNF